MIFLPHFQGKVLRAGDLVESTSMSNELATYGAKFDKEILWTNSMFGGMPSYQIGGARPTNFLKYLTPIMSLKTQAFTSPAIIITGMICFFIMMLVLGISPWLSLLGALLFGLSTNNFILIEAGHPTKLYTICYSPLVIAGVVSLFKQKYLIGAALFGIGFGLNVMANHPQMTYYLGIILAILVAIYLIETIKKKYSWKEFTLALVSLSVVGLIGLLCSASTLWTTYEYSTDTMRGKPILEADANTIANTSSSTTDGLAWDYAMQWSNGPIDILATFIPKAAGGGSGEWLDGKSLLGKAIGQRQAFQGPTYWGDLPFTSGPIYLGAVAIFLFVFGLFILKGKMKWWLGLAVLLTLILSMGKNMELINQLFFDYFPLYNKFRAPSSILGTTVILIPILGILALSEIVKSNDKSKYVKPLLITTSILGGLSLLMWIGGSWFFDFTSAGDAQYEQIKDVLLEQRQEMFSSSSFRTLFLVLVTAGNIWLYLTDKIKSTIMIVIISLIGIGDFVQINQNYLSKRNFVTPKALKSENEPREVDKLILQDKDPYFRVYDASINTFNSASSSYFHKTIGGYHPAKLQRFQDVIDRHIANNNQSVLNMLNTKYYIFNGQDEKPVAQINNEALGNVWFVDQYTIVNSPNAEIDSLNRFNPSETAIVHKEFSQYLSGLQPNKNGNITLTTYSPDKLDYQSMSSSEQLAVFSDMWYGPNKGWNAYIDGKPVEHIRVNYILRGLRIPAGNHNITFEFKPQSYYLGNKISAASSAILLLLLIFVVGSLIRSTYYDIKLKKA